MSTRLLVTGWYDGIFWLCHCGSWFAFEEEVFFKKDIAGGFFASTKNLNQVKSISQNGINARLYKTLDDSQDAAK